MFLWRQQRHTSSVLTDTDRHVYAERCGKWRARVAGQSQTADLGLHDSQLEAATAIAEHLDVPLETLMKGSVSVAILLKRIQASKKFHSCNYKIFSALASPKNLRVAE